MQYEAPKTFTISRLLPVTAVTVYFICNTDERFR